MHSTTPLSDGRGRWRSRHLAVLGLAVACAVFLGWRGRPHGLSTGGDDALLITLSYSLEQGRYQDEFLPHPAAHGKYPPGTPAWILLVRRLAGPGLDAVRAGNLLLVMLTGILIGDAVRRIGGAWLGVGAASVVLLNPATLRVAGSLLSEPLFMALSTGAAWAALRADERPSPAAAWAAVLAVASFLARVTGLAVVAGIWGWCVWRRRWRLLGGLSLLAVAVVGGWFLHAARIGQGGLGASYADEVAIALSPGLVARVAHAAAYYTGRALPDALGLPTVPGTPIDNLLWLLVLGSCGVLGFWVMLRQWPAGAATLLASAALLAAWPWPVDRLLVPLLPLLLAGITLGAGRMPRALGIGSGRGAWAAGLVIVALLASAVPASSGWGRTARACDPPAREPSACPDRAEQAFFTAIEFLRDSIPAGAVVVSGRPATVFLLAGKRAVHYHGLRANDGVGVGRRMRAWGATYLLLGPFPPDQWRDLAPLLAAECAQFTVRTRPHPSVVLLEHGPAGGGRDDACDASSPHSPPTAHPAGDGQTSR